jgi:hypothetical protein
MKFTNCPACGGVVYKARVLGSNRTIILDVRLTCYEFHPDDLVSATPKAMAIHECRLAAPPEPRTMSLGNTVPKDPEAAFRT